MELFDLYEWPEINGYLGLQSYFMGVIPVTKFATSRGPPCVCFCMSTVSIPRIVYLSAAETLIVTH